MTQNSAKFYNTALNLGMELVREAIWDGDRCTWIGGWYDPIDGKYTFTTRSFGPDLYSGTSGIAYFLSLLYKIEKDALALRVIEGAVNHSLSTIDSMADNGFYSGKIGIAYALIETGKNTEREDWIKAGMGILYGLEPKQAYPVENDVISGIAGSLPVFLYAWAETKDEKFLDKALTLGNLLYNNAERHSYGWGWKTIPNMPVLTGLSHGCAGISGALLELYVAVKDEKFLNAAMEGIKYEQTFFSADYGNWPDFRNGHPPDRKNYTYSMAWCTGAPGVAVSRLRCAEITHNPMLSFHADIALNTTSNSIIAELGAKQDMSNYSLCHGLAGNADILLESSNPLHKNIAETVGLTGIEKYGNSRLPWPSGVISKQKTPGLMMGYAGTGYFYLRLMDNTLKTVLLPPKFMG